MPKGWVVPGGKEVDLEHRVTCILVQCTSKVQEHGQGFSEGTPPSVRATAPMPSYLHEGTSPIYRW